MTHTHAHTRTHTHMHTHQAKKAGMGLMGKLKTVTFIRMVESSTGLYWHFHKQGLSRYKAQQ